MTKSKRFTTEEAKPIFDSSLVPFQSNRRTEPSVTPLELTF